MARRSRWVQEIEDEADAGQPCARDRRCEERDYLGNPAMGPRAFCETDRKWIEKAIRDLPGSYAELWLRLVPSGQQQERVSGTRDPAAPLELTVEAFLRRIVFIAQSWEQEVRVAARLTDLTGDRKRPGVAVADAARVLAAHLTTLLALPSVDMARHMEWSEVAEADPEAWVVAEPGGGAWVNTTMDGTAAGLEFLALGGRIRGMLGMSRQRRRITEVRCDDCKEKTLVQMEAREGGWEPVIRCTACPNIYMGPRYDLLLGRIYQVQLEALAAS